MTTIAAIKAVLLDKEKTKKSGKTNPNAMKSSNPTKPVQIATSSKKTGSSAQSLADAINNARKPNAQQQKSSALARKSPSKKYAMQDDYEIVEITTSPFKVATFSESQVKRMTKEFSKKNVLTKYENIALSKEIKLTDDQVKSWFANMRRRKVRSVISKQEKTANGIKLHGLKSVEVSALLPMADIMSLSRTGLQPEVVDILDDSFDSSDGDVSLVETIQVKTHKPIKEKDVAKFKPIVVKTKPIKVAKSKTDDEKGTVKEVKSKKVIENEDFSQSNSKGTKPCTKEEDLVEELLRRIEELEEDLKVKEGDLYYTKNDLNSVQTTLEGKERVLTTVQDSIPKVVSEHKKALQAKDYEIKEERLRNVELQKQLADKLNKSNSNLKKDDIENSNKKVDANTDESWKKRVNAKEEEIFALKLYNKNLLDEKLQIEISNKEKQDTESEHFKVTIKKFELKVKRLLEDLCKQNDDIKILKYKQRQAEGYSVKLEQTQRTLDENRRETLALKDYERKLTKKITDLEFDLYTKSAERDTQSLVISRLNEKIQHQNVENKVIQELCPDDIDYSYSHKYSAVLNNGLCDDLTVAFDDSVRDTDQVLLKGLSHTTPYVVNTPERRTLCDASTPFSDYELDYPEENEEEPFESLCAEIETLCVPTKRPLPFFSVSTSDCKKLKISEDILDAQESKEAVKWVEEFIIKVLLENIFSSN